MKKSSKPTNKGNPQNRKQSLYAQPPHISEDYEEDLRQEVKAKNKIILEQSQKIIDLQTKLAAAQNSAQEKEQMYRKEIKQIQGEFKKISELLNKCPKCEQYELDLQKKENEYLKSKLSYESKLEESDKAFTNQKKLWSKIYTELLDEISELKNQLYDGELPESHKAPKAPQDQTKGHIKRAILSEKENA